MQFYLRELGAINALEEHTGTIAPAQLFWMIRAPRSWRFWRRRLITKAFP
jgi:hypothetical protein